jgi:hypothetical protein
VDDFCGKVPLAGSATSFEMAGQANAQVRSLLKKLADIGVQGAAKVQHSEYEGYLQKDLLAATQNSTECKLNALKAVMSAVFGATAADPYRLPKTVRVELAGLVNEGNKVRVSMGSSPRPIQ